MPKVKSPSELVASTVANLHQPCWFDSLCKSQQDYVMGVVDAMKKTPTAKAFPVAAALIAELNIPRKSRVVADFLKTELYRMKKNEKTK
jgi:hypothetical protein